MTGPADELNMGITEKEVLKNDFFPSDFCPDCLVNFTLGDLSPRTIERVQNKSPQNMPL